MKLFPSIEVPTEYNSIVNVHQYFKILNERFQKKLLDLLIQLHWLFLKKDHISITISNTNSYNNFDSEKIANIIWKEICSYMKIDIPLPEFQVVKEKRQLLFNLKNFKLLKD